MPHGEKLICFLDKCELLEFASRTDIAVVESTVG
jgi:hypothetical protein